MDKVTRFGVSAIVFHYTCETKLILLLKCLQKNNSDSPHTLSCHILSSPQPRAAVLTICIMYIVYSISANVPLGVLFFKLHIINSIGNRLTYFRGGSTPDRSLWLTPERAVYIIYYSVLEISNIILLHALEF